MRALRPRVALGAVCAVLGIALGACGGDDGRPAVRGAGEPGEGGTLIWTVGTPIVDIDPLAAESPTAQLVTRQIHEPLVASYDGPFGEPGDTPGLALGVRPRGGGTRWDVRLRSGVRFQDGSQLNATAVLANARRWIATDAGRAALPGLIAADAPQPDVVRLFFAEPRNDVPERLAEPRLGIVAPTALRSEAGVGDRSTGQFESGSGPFELRERGGGRLLLAHNTGWWGSERGLGPALDQIEFRVIGSAGARARELRAGNAQVAGELTRSQARAAAADPLIAAAPQAGGGWLAHERSVRGLGRGGAVPSLSGAWLATLAPGS